MAQALERNLRQEIENCYKARIAALDDDIRAMKADHTAKGQLKSGATLKKMADLCSTMLDGLANDLTDAVKSVSESAGVRRLGSERIVALYVHAIPPTTPFARERLSEVVELVQQPNLLDRLHQEVVSHHGDVTRDLKTNLDRLIIGTTPTSNKTLLAIELFLLVAIAFVAGAWWQDTSGNYEPLLAIGTVLLALIEVARRVRS